MENTKPHAALLASPGLGHLVPVLELGNRLLTLHGFRVTIFVASTGSSPTQSQLLELSPSHLDIVKLPPVNVSGLIDPTDTILSEIVAMMRETRPALRSALSALKSTPNVLIVDFFGTEALEIAEEFKMRKYVYIPCSAWFAALTLHVPVLDEEVKGDLFSRFKRLCIPGCKPVYFKEAFTPLLDRKSREYDEYIQIGSALSTVDGILVNTWKDPERETVNAMEGDEMWGRLRKVPVHPIGPLVRFFDPLTVSRSGVLDWLDARPTRSVVFVSFGSGGTMSAQQMTELAWGLELSRQRFIWVVRPPVENDSSAAVFTVGNGDSDSNNGTPYYLPEGFCERTQSVGLVIPTWAPQAEILTHPSIGAFMNHCGWNSTLESIVNGIPMIAWPLYAEQPMNAALLEGLGVALRTPTEGVVGRKEVERMVRKLLQEKEGRAMRERVRELKRSAVEAMSKSGSSYGSLSKVADDCKNWVRDSAHA